MSNQFNATFTSGLIVPFVIWTLIWFAISNWDAWDNVLSYFVYPDKGLWFLWTLFFINMFFVTSRWLSEIMNIKQELIVIGFSLSFILFMIVLKINMFGFQFIAYYFLFYSIGYYFHKYYDKIFSNNLIVNLLLFVIWVFLAWNWSLQDAPPLVKVIPLPAVILLYSYRFVTALIAVYL